MSQSLSIGAPRLSVPRAPVVDAAMEADPLREFLAESDSLRNLLATARRFAATDVPVLIQGETGSGKELVARAIHAHSASAQGPWVDINCAALPDHLAESELFGYERGAFSGADVRKPGLFELADGGTLFLDEIGELPLALQGKLLRVLDRMEYFRLGGTRKIRVRARVVAATNRVLAEEVEQGRFRADLYHRLSAAVLEVPPLRERPADIAPLAALFLNQVARGMEFDESALALLGRYSWPGNVRELRNAVQRAAAVAQGNRIGPADFPARVSQFAGATQAPCPEPADDGPRQWVGDGVSDWRLDRMERRLIEAALTHTGGHQQRAATLLGVSRRTLSRKLREWSTPAPVPVS